MAFTPRPIAPAAGSPANHPTPRRSPWRQRLARRVVRWLIERLFDVRVDGLERMPAGPYLAIANHTSWLDGFLLMAYLPARPRLRVVADADQMRKTWWRRFWVAVTAVVLPVDRRTPRSAAAGLREAARLLATGEALAIFPEGATSSSGELLPLQPGAALLALHSQALVVPVGIAGANILYLGRLISVVVGSPFIPAARAPGRAGGAGMTEEFEHRLRAVVPPSGQLEPGRTRCRWLTHLLR